MAADTPVLVLDGLSKSFGRKTAVDSLDLSVGGGEIIGLLGPNGAGKTTTLKMIAGLVIPDSGRISIAGVDAQADPDRARAAVSFVPDQPSLYPRLTGREFLRFMARARGISGDVAEARISLQEKLFDMEGWLDQRAETYSHGMTQRVALSAAFLPMPAVYVIDEPLVGLDPASAETFNRMCRHAASGGAAVVLSSHTLSIVRRTCDRLAILDRGRLAASVETRGVDEASLERLFFELTGTGPADVEAFFGGPRRSAGG